MNVILVLKHAFFSDDKFYDASDQQILCSVAIGLMYMRFMFWMRLFTPTALFMRLLNETFVNIVSFTVLYMMLITCFANIMYILNEKR